MKIDGATDGKRKLGSITCTVWADDKGENIEVSHETDLSPELVLMQTAMSGNEKREAVNIRALACQRVAQFFLFLRNPDRRHICA